MDIRHLLEKTISYETMCPAEIADFLYVSKASVSNMIARGTIKPIKKCGASKLFLRSDIEAYRDRAIGSRYREPEVSADHPLLTILPQHLEQTQGELPPEILVLYGQLSEQKQEVAVTAMAALLTGLRNSNVAETDLYPAQMKLRFEKEKENDND